MAALRRDRVTSTVLATARASAGTRARVLLPVAARRGRAVPVR